MLPCYENEAKSKLPGLWTNRENILENGNFLASVPLTKKTQAVQVQAGIHLLGEVEQYSVL